MVWLPDGGNFLRISLFVLTQSTNVTDTHTQTPHDGYVSAYNSIAPQKPHNYSNSLETVTEFIRQEHGGTSMS